MIRDPGAGPHESPEPQPAIKYDRIMYDLHRPPVPAAVTPVTPMDVDDSETPLDMTVRRKDSDRQPVSSAITASGDLQLHDSSSGGGGGGGSSRDAPINLNTRPSVITKAPPPPIKKRISSMHSNGEIVIKSAVGDNLSPVNCDVFIEEHFRRSLGNTYASIYGNNNNNTSNNNNNNNPQKSSGSDTRNSSTSSSSSISSSSSCSNSSTGLSSISSSSGISSAASSGSNLIGSSVNFSVSSHLGSVSPVVRHNNAIPPVEISPLLNVKLEPGLAQQPTRPEVKVKNEPGTVLNVRPDSEEEVDDHFAKALGNDTWKMIQEKKMNL